MKTNSFILLKKQKEKFFEEFEKGNYKDFFIYCNPIFHNELIFKNNALFYGYIIDPYYPKKSNTDIFDDISKISNNEILFETMSKYSGRFLLMINDICFTDTCGQMQTFYYKNKEEFIITTSQKFIRELYPDCTINKDKISILGKQKEFYGYEGLIDNSYLVLPNHYLDINKKEIYRYPLDYDTDKSLDLTKVVKIFEGSFEAITHRYGSNLHMGLTGGRDTRCLLSFAHKYKNKINFFQGCFGNQKELSLAKQLTKKLSLNFTTIDLKKIKPAQEFINIYNSNRFTPYYSYIPIKSNLKYYMYKNNKNCMIVTGTCTPWRHNNDYDTVVNYKKLLGVNKCNSNSYLNSFCKQYFEKTKNYSDKYNIDIRDLLHWEQCFGFWNASNTEEYNIFGNVFIPFNNRIIINEFFKFSKNDRKYCNHYKKIIKMMGMDELLDIDYC